MIVLINAPCSNPLSLPLPFFLSLLHSLSLSPTTIWYMYLQKRPKAEGYPDQATTLYSAVPISEFVLSDKHLTLLAECSKLEFDRRGEVFSRHPLTTEEIRLLCDDVKVLGPTELRQLVRCKRDELRTIDLYISSPCLILESVL